jgi:transposase InsO family protein
VTQQARNLAWQLQDGTPPVRVLLHDRDAKFPASFDAVFHSEGLQIALSPPRCPWANGIAERWIRSARAECLDHLLILNERHLYRVLREDARFYDERRPHQALGQQCPVPLARGPAQGHVHCRDVLGGMLHDYRRQVA